MTFEQWYNENYGHIRNGPMAQYETMVKDIAGEAWKANQRQISKMMKLLNDFDDYVGSAAPDGSWYCDEGDLADRFDELKHDN